MKLINIKKASELVGVTPKTLRLWEKEKKIDVIYTPNGHRRYNLEYLRSTFLNINQNIIGKRKTIIYGRVSTNNQKNNLYNQINELKSYATINGLTVDDILTDIGSGLNYNRTNFLKLIKMILENKIENVIISFPDRLTRFSFKFFEWLLVQYNVNLIVANKIEISEQQEMTEDLISIIQHYASKLYGKRSYKKKLKEIIDENIKD